MRRRRLEMGLTYEDISELSKVPLATVRKVLGGITKSPRLETVQALERVLSSGGARCGHQYRFSGNDIYLEETSASYGASPSYQYDSSARKLPESGDFYPLLPYKRQGEYTKEDRDRLPEECRTELIDGVLYDMASPRRSHQLIVTELLFQLRLQIEKCGKNCRVFVSPSDVKLSADNRNILQPDIYILCDPELMTNDDAVCVPPFIIEVLSPSTRRKDLLLKAWKYATSGVKEYWTVDPDKMCVTVRDYEKDPDGADAVSYTFEDNIPIRISGGHCSVDFGMIHEQLKNFLSLPE